MTRPGGLGKGENKEEEEEEDTESSDDEGPSIIMASASPSPAAPKFKARPTKVTFLILSEQSTVNMRLARKRTNFNIARNAEFRIETLGNQILRP